MFATLACGLSAQTPPSDSSACQRTLAAFLSSPNEHRLREIQQSHCAALLTASNADLGLLNRLVERGSRSAAELSARNLKSLDGGNLEDALIALGEFSEHDMKYLLVLAHEGLLSGKELTDALTMLPLAMSDHPAGQLKRIVRRKRMAEAVSDKYLETQKTYALNSLNDFASEIKSSQKRQ